MLPSQHPNNDNGSVLRDTMMAYVHFNATKRKKNNPKKPPQKPL